MVGVKQISKYIHYFYIIIDKISYITLAFNFNVLKQFLNYCFAIYFRYIIRKKTNEDDESRQEFVRKVQNMDEQGEASEELLQLRQV